MSGIDLLSSLNSTGSGVNLKELAASLVEASFAAPKAAANTALSGAEVSISALGTVRAQLSGLSTALAGFAANDILSVSSSGTAVGVTVKDRAQLVESTHDLAVLQLAGAQVLEFGGFSAATAPVGAGQLTVDFGIWYADDTGAESFAANPAASAVTIDIAEGATLGDLAEALNSLTGVSATVLDKGDGTFSLGVLSESGAGNAIRLTAAGAGGLAQFDTTATNSLVQVQAARNAVLQMDGITLTRPGNIISDVVPGATLTLTATTASVGLTVGRDEPTALANMQQLVTQLNGTLSMLAELTARKTESTPAGDLAGDAGIAGLGRQIEALLAGPIAGYGARAVHLAELGIETRLDGTLGLNTATFSAAFASDPARFDAVFENRLASDTPGLSISAGTATSVAAGLHRFERDAQTGAARLDGTPVSGLDLGDGRFAFTLKGAGASGLVLTVDAGVESGTISVGQSFVSRLTALLDQATASSGLLDLRSTAFAGQATEAQATLDSLATKAAGLQTFYMTRFSAMEQAVTRFNSVSSYLDSLVAQWNNTTD